MVGGMVQNSTNQNHYQHQQPICSSTFFFYINNKIRPTSTINIIINIRNMPNSTTRENQHQQKFLFSSTTICLTTNIGHRLQQQNTFNNLGTNDWLWSREVGTQKFLETNMADEEERIRRCVREELELNLVSRTRNLIRSAASSSVPELNNVFAGQTAQRSSFGSSSRPTVKR